MPKELCPCRTVPATVALGTHTDSDAVQAQMSYSECCQPLHQGQAIAATSEALMRSRYSAFVLQLIDYIIDTTVPAQQSLLSRQDISDWAQQTQWAGLQIVQHIAKLDKRHSQVEFKAYYHSLEAGNLALHAHHELSTFVKVTSGNKPAGDAATEQSVWYFLDPTVVMGLSQKQPCLCGSGEKFKRCCGAYL